MIPKRVPIRSPIQLPDLQPKQTPAPKALELNQFAELGKLIEQLSDLKEELEKGKSSDAWKGKQGEPGEKGESVFSPEEFMPYVEYILHMVKRDLPIPKDGRDGVDGTTPVHGVDYHTDAERQEIIDHISSRIPKAKDGISPVIDHSQIASAVIAQILDGKLLKKEHITGLDQEIASYRAQFANGKGYVHGGGDTIVAGTGVTITPNPNGTKTVSAPASGGLNFLAATGTVDNSNKTFTFASMPTLVIVNGATYRNGNGVTITDTAAVLDNPPGNGGDVYGLG